MPALPASIPDLPIAVNAAALFDLPRGRALPTAPLSLLGDGIDPGSEVVLPVPGEEKAGQRVRHARFGIGVVKRALPEGDKLEIDFGDVGVKVLVAKYVEELPDE